MPSVADMTDEDLMKIAGVGSGDISSMSDADLMKIARQDSNFQSKDFLPNKSKVDELVASRPDSVASMIDSYKTGHPVLGTLNLLSVPFQRLEAGVANAGLDAQSGKPSSMLDSFIQGVSGQKQGQLGDWFRTTGFGGKFNEALASTTGLLGSGALGMFGTKAAGATGNALLDASGKLKTNVVNIAQPVQFAQKVRNAMFGMRTKLGQELDAKVTALSDANPNKTIDLSSPMAQLQSALADNVNNPGLANDVKQIIRKVKDPNDSALLNDLIANPDSASNLTLAQAEKVKRIISNAPSIKSKIGNRFANWTPGDHELLDLIDEIKLAQSDVFPDELGKIRAPYAAYMNNYRVVKNKFKPGSLLKSIAEGFGDKEIENMAKNVLPEDIYNQIKGRRTTLLVGKTAAGLAGGKMALDKIWPFLNGD